MEATCGADQSRVDVDPDAPEVMEREAVAERTRLSASVGLREEKRMAGRATTTRRPRKRRPPHQSL
jgi:hypothetical protein